MRYELRLKNVYTKRNLQTKSDAINKVFNHICNEGMVGRRFRGITKIRVVEIMSKSIIIEVDETSKTWHPAVGKRLANKHGMREFCNPDNREEMFEWYELN